MASKHKPKRHKRKARSHGTRAWGGPVVTTHRAPSLERVRVGGPLNTDLAPLAERELASLDSIRQIQAGMVALARGTDALVTRIVESAREGSRDPAEHLLDLSRAYYQEETAQGSHNVQCDRCKLKSPGMASTAKANRLAESLGWIVTDDFDHCPACKDGGLMLPGASAALAVVPALTPAEMILVVRVRYIVDNISDGMSIEALLQNSVRSGHRSMLSDLAASTRYDTIPLIEQVTSLIGQRGADVHPLFLSDSAKIWSFFLKLYDALKKEDDQ
ncbi:MAG TPA: hypothetical protein VK571_03360 [Gemmatimonadaceae bacterium]|nr:hypothetical protein [Gemmatimonadaceae bacterium]